MKTKEFISKLDEPKLMAAIAEAEKTTSGEIRVLISEKQVADPLAESERAFLKLGMEKTEARNGVLIFFAPLSQTFAIVGDIGVNAKCGAEFWRGISDSMVPLLKSGQFTEAILQAVGRVGEALANHFPRSEHDRDELSNSIVRDQPEK